MRVLFYHRGSHHEFVRSWFIVLVRRVIWEVDLDESWGRLLVLHWRQRPNVWHLNISGKFVIPIGEWSLQRFVLRNICSFSSSSSPFSNLTSNIHHYCNQYKYHHQHHHCNNRHAVTGTITTTIFIISSVIIENVKKNKKNPFVLRNLSSGSSEIWPFVSIVNNQRLDAAESSLQPSLSL